MKSFSARKKKTHFSTTKKPLFKNLGICVWKALRTIRNVDHAAWRHLNGVPVEERDLPLPVPDVLALEAAKAKAAANGENENADEENDALAAATAVVSQGEQLVSAAEEEAGTSKARRRKSALPEVRAAAMEEAAALARELDAFHLSKREKKEISVTVTTATATKEGGAKKGLAVAAVKIEC